MYFIYIDDSVYPAYFRRYLERPVAGTGGHGPRVARRIYFLFQDLTPSSGLKVPLYLLWTEACTQVELAISRLDHIVVDSYHRTKPFPLWP
jgi:hypothetical protein